MLPGTLLPSSALSDNWIIRTAGVPGFKSFVKNQESIVFLERNHTPTISISFLSPLRNYSDGFPIHAEIGASRVHGEHL